VHQAVGEVAPDAAHPDERQLRLALDRAELVDEVAGADRRRLGHRGEERAVVAVDIEVPVRVVAEPPGGRVEPHLGQQVFQVGHRVLGAAGGVFRVDLHARDARRLGDVLLLQVRDQGAEPTSERHDDRHRPLGAEVEEPGDVGHPDRVEQHQGVEPPRLQLATDALHARVVCRLADGPADGRRLGPSGLRRLRGHAAVPPSCDGPQSSAPDATREHEGCQTEPIRERPRVPSSAWPVSRV